MRRCHYPLISYILHIVPFDTARQSPLLSQPMTHYYIDISGTKDGPHDLVTIMRRIRAQKIGPDTGIYLDESPTFMPASVLPDTSLFFSREDAVQTTAPKAAEIHSLRLTNLLHEGWRFTSENSIMTVFAGGMLLLTILIAAGMASTLGPIVGGMLTWVVFIMFHYIFLICCQRMYRGQPFSVKFWNEQLSPIISMLLFAAITVGLMEIGGFLLLVIPGFLVAVSYIFVPFFIMDRHMSLIESMHASRLLVRKHNRRYQANITILVMMHVGCLLLIAPIPLSLPMFAAALSRFYEELSTS